MIVGDCAIPILHVEGKNDVHVVGALMKASNHPLDPNRGPVIIQSHDSCAALLDSFSSSVKSAVGLGCPVGFVLDMDRPEDNRIEQIRARLRLFGVDLDDAELTDDGVVKEIEGIRVGIWFMPSPAAKSGKLEDFLREMIDESDCVRPLSDNFVASVEKNIAEEDRFRNIDREKAEMYAWLSVQATPGLPYGAAINAQLLSAGHPIASKFVAWMCKVFDLA